MYVKLWGATPSTGPLTVRRPHAKKIPGRIGTHTQVGARKPDAWRGGLAPRLIAATLSDDSQTPELKGYFNFCCCRQRFGFGLGDVLAPRQRHTHSTAALYFGFTK